MPHPDAPVRPAPPAARVGELDALRGLAALAVVAFHYTTFYQQEVGHVQPLPFGFPAGNYGVHLFFLISGFVIFMTLERTRAARDFLVSRFSRLYPAYWVAILATAAVVYTLGMPQQRIPTGDVIADATMLQEILGFEHLDGSYWTLQVELFFYAQMLLWFVLGQLKHIRWIILAWLVLAVAYGETVQHHLHFSYTVRELLILRHIPFFALGILFYRVWSQPRIDWRDLGLMALALGAIALVQAPVYFAAAVVCSGIFTLFVAGRLRWLRAPLFAFLGAISYSLYLLHQAIGFALIHQMETHGVPPLVAVVTTSAVVIALAWTLTRLVEQPAMAAIRAWWRRRDQAPARAVPRVAVGFAPAAPATPALGEPHLTRFVDAVRSGASLRDIHDTAGHGAYDGTDAVPVSDAFLARELGRVDMHLRSLCPPLVTRLGHAARILDAGCGTGGTTVALALSALAPTQVAGFDANAGAVAAARERALGYGLAEPRVLFLHVPAGTRLPFEDGAFDLVTCVSVLEFISTPGQRAAFLGELRRVTRPGGHVYLATPNPLHVRELHSRRWFGNQRRAPGFPWASSAGEIARMMPGCAVESLSAERLRHHPHLRRLAWAAPLLARAAPWQRLLVAVP